MVSHSIWAGSVSRYASSTGPGGSDEDNSIYMNTAVHPKRPDCGEDTDDDMEEIYVNDCNSQL